MINIQDIVPFIKKGWVACDKNGEWGWYEKKPAKDKYLLQWIIMNYNDDYYCLSEVFDIAPADDWTKSLIEVKGVKR